MHTKPDSKILDRIVDTSHGMSFDVLGPVVEFLTSPDGQGEPCVMKGTIPPGAVVPLHSHPDSEAFFVIAGTQQVLTKSATDVAWHEVQAGDYVYIAPGTPHAWRNDSEDPVIDLIVTTPPLGRFFQEAGKPTDGASLPPSPGDLARMVAVAAKYHYWLGSVEENAAVGINLPGLVADGASAVTDAHAAYRRLDQSWLDRVGGVRRRS